MDELDNDPEFDSALARINAAEQTDIEADFVKEIGERRQKTEHPIQTWVTNLPKNIGIGAYKAAINTVDTIADFGAAALEANANAALSRGPSNAGRTDSEGKELQPVNVPTLEEAFPEFSQSVRSFTDSWERNDNLGDDIAQGVAQFTLPFAGTLKLLGGIRAGMGAGATLARAGAAEGVTAGSAFDPHDGRLADLIKLGADSESRFGDLMRKVAPDGSLVNSYIDYMTSRDGYTPDERRNGVSEGEWEGRFKNAVDSLVGSAAIAGIVKSAGIAFKGLKQQIASATPSAGTLGVPNQKGMVAFHGTRHDFDTFDLNRVGSGEGAQMFGHGLYFAENPEVAKQYRTAGGPFLVHKGKEIFAEEWDGEPVLGAVKDLLLEGRRAGLSDRGVAMYAEREIKRNPARYGLKNRDEQIAALETARETKVQQGKLYTVDIPDGAVEKMLDHDAVLNEQPHVVAALKGTSAWKLLQDDWRYFSQGEGSEKEMLESLTGADVYEVLSGKSAQYDPASLGSAFEGGANAASASKFLREHGIPGIKYLDRGSRGAGDGTRNMVLFDDKLAKVIKKE